MDKKRKQTKKMNWLLGLCKLSSPLHTQWEYPEITGDNLTIIQVLGTDNRDLQYTGGDGMHVKFKVSENFMW